ncbi:MAG: NADH-quinone oxidoreductase subunit C [Candidatus Bathyarchaeia archaeon]|jgi:Ni,Fe-hydrogenase III large subunit/NADH:ubiquinone oxidoreductase subunit C
MERFEQTVELLKNNMGDSILEFNTPKPRRAYVLLKPETHREAVSLILKNIERSGLSTITGTDLGTEIELNYHMFCGGCVTLKTRLSREKPVTKTITDILPGANLYEREVFDLLGVVFDGHPNLERLMLPETWPQGDYPLRRDWKLPVIPESVMDSEKPVGTETVNLDEASSIINVVIGPQHPVLHEPERFSFKIDGETVVDVEARLGYVHRGIEKAAERMMYFQDVFLVERICGICNVAHTTCFCQAVEAIGNIETPSRALYLRTIVHELNRVHSHLLLLGVAGHLLGFEALFQHVWRDREPVMDIIERITGNRLMSGYNTIGGVRREIDSTTVAKTLKTIEAVRKRATFYKKVFEEDATLRLRTEGVGVLSKEDALKFSVVGPVARGSGIAADVRKDDPYAVYDEIPFNVISYNECDTWARLMVRVDEVLESLDILNYALGNVPEGKMRIRVPRRQPEGEAVSRVEAPRGELIHYVKSDGTAYPYRVKVRAPTLANLVAFPDAIRGSYIADIPSVMGSLDPCFSCTDRMVFVDTQKNKKWNWSLDEVNASSNRKVF